MARIILGIIAACTVLMLVAITVLLFTNSIPLFYTYSLSDFLFGAKWHPASDPAKFGLLPLLWGSLVVTFIALLVALPVGIASAMYLNTVASPGVREFLKPVMELLGSVPSVVYGLFGITVLAPYAQNLLSLPVGQCALVAGITLGLMVVPITVSISEDALASVPREILEAALALGATRWEALTDIILPAAKSGIWASILLSLGRAIGETMTVLMVAGGAAQISLSPLKPIRPMTVAIAAEMGETPFGSPHYHALFAVASSLFVLTLVLNLIANKYAGNKMKK